MVPGIDTFRDKFKDYIDYYTIIGGTACVILLSEAEFSFRATNDIDLILIMEEGYSLKKFRKYSLFLYIKIG